MKLLPALLLCALLLTSCSLDNFLANEKKLDHYTLSTEIIPEDKREMVTFSSEGHKLYGFWVQPPVWPTSRYAVLYCHGNKDNIEEYWNRVERFYEMGVSCFIFDYRGFGMSEGTPSAKGLYADGHAALAYVRDSLGIPDDRIVLYGFSLGNVVAIDLANLMENPRALIAEAPFASADALLQTSVPLDLPGSFVMDEPVNNAEQIRLVHTRYLQLHGQQDDFVPWETNGRIVWENAPEPKTLILLPTAIHTNIPEVMGHAAYDHRILQFIIGNP
jgi:uncharacterized protein